MSNMAAGKSKELNGGLSSPGANQKSRGTLKSESINMSWTYIVTPSFKSNSGCTPWLVWRGSKDMAKMMQNRWNLMVSVDLKTTCFIVRAAYARPNDCCWASTCTSCGSCKLAPSPSLRTLPWLGRYHQ